MYEVVLTHDDQIARMPALQYQRMLREDNPLIEFPDGSSHPPEECEKKEVVTLCGGWTTVNISGEAAHLLDILIDEPKFLHGGIPDFGTILRNVSDPLLLDQAVVRVDNLVEDAKAVADIAAAPVVDRILDELRKKFPLDSPTKKDVFGALKAAIDKSTRPSIAELIRELNKRLKQDDINETPSDSEAEV